MTSPFTGARVLRPSVLAGSLFPEKVQVLCVWEKVLTENQHLGCGEQRVASES